MQPARLLTACGCGVRRAIKEGKAEEALGHYNAALAAEPAGSAAFVAVLYANRAAAHQSLGQPTAAVADCLRATALNPSYTKVLSCSPLAPGPTVVSAALRVPKALLAWHSRVAPLVSLGSSQQVMQVFVYHPLKGACERNVCVGSRTIFAKSHSGMPLDQVRCRLVLSDLLHRVI